MDCRTCQPTLIDLLHGELAIDAAEEAEAHLKQCQSCRSAFDKLSLGIRAARNLPLMDPPQAVGARLMQLAEEHANAAAVLRRQQARKPPRAWQSLLEFVGRFAMARQVGMATLMLLIVAVGLWSLPQLERAPLVDGGTVVNPEPSGEAAPSTGVQPAEPLDLKVDLRAGRIRSKEEEQSAALHDTASVAEATAKAEPGLAAAKLERMGEADRVSAHDDLSASREGAKSLSKRQRRAESKSSAAGVDTLAQLEGYGRADKGGGSGPIAQARGRAEEERAFPASNAARAAAPPVAPASPAQAPARGSDELLDGTPARASNSDAPATQRESSRKPAASSAPAKPKAGAAAETATTAADCGASLSRHQEIVAADPASAQAGESLLAMARCRTQRGERALARALLERAARNVHVASRARALLSAQSAPAEGKSVSPYPN